MQPIKSTAVSRMLLTTALVAACGGWAAGCATAVAKAPPTPVVAPPAGLDMAAFDRLVGQRDVVIMGEDSHGTKDVHQLIPALFEHLVVEKGFRLFVFESAWGIDDALQGFIDSDRTSVDGDEAFFLNAFNSQPTVDMLIWIRNWNRQHPDDKVMIAGYQPEQPFTDIAAVRAFTAAHAPGKTAEVEAALAPCKIGEPIYKSNLDFIIGMNNRRRKDKLPSFNADERKACVEGTLKAEKILAGIGDRKAAQEVGLHLLSLRVYVDTLTAVVDNLMFGNLSLEQGQVQNAAMYTAGDKARFEIFEGLRETRYGQAKAFLWMHNWHGMKDTGEVGFSGPAGISIGTRLAQRYGARLTSIGVITPCAAECKEPEGSVEPQFGARFGDTPAVIDFNDRSAIKELDVATPGAVFPNLHGGFYFTNVVLKRQWDGVIYLPKASPLH